jgi:hypothetical protein
VEKNPVKMEKNPVCVEKNPVKWRKILHGYQVYRYIMDFLASARRTMEKGVATT